MRVDRPRVGRLAMAPSRGPVLGWVLCALWAAQPWATGLEVQGNELSSDWRKIYMEEVAAAQRFPTEDHIFARSPWPAPAAVAPGNNHSVRRADSLIPTPLGSLRARGPAALDPSKSPPPSPPSPAGLRPLPAAVWRRGAAASSTSTCARWWWRPLLGGLAGHRLAAGSLALRMGSPAPFLSGRSGRLEAAPCEATWAPRAAIASRR